jgi:L-ascorbate metabolism protein UlaG (beta-lactamase superfamily)
VNLRYLAHASLLVESGGTRLVTDPWLDGPTYLHAWWHFPRPAASGKDLVGVDYVYLTHEHADHFHPQTLAALPRSTPILIGKFFSKRFVAALSSLGFKDVRELVHGKRVKLGDRMNVTSYQYRADDTALVVETPEATVLDLNDCLLRARSLDALLRRHPTIDLLAMSFANAEAYPIVYTHVDPVEKTDWDDASRFDDFLAKVRAIGPRRFVPFASMFAFLSPELFSLNDKIVAPTRLLERSKTEVEALGLAMNPGDEWSPSRGHVVKSEIAWRDKDAILRREQRERAHELRALAAIERVPAGELARAFASYFDSFARRIPWPLARKLDLALRIDVGDETLWLRFSRGKLDRHPPTDDSAWEAKMTIDPWPLWRAVTRQDSWQSLGISCRFRMTLCRDVRPREVWLWFLLYLDDLGYLDAFSFFTPRALAVMARRHREVAEYASQVLSGAFVDASLRNKFVG